MRWVFISPHLDDVVLSCGGLIWEWVQAGHKVEILTICAGMPPPADPLSDFAQQLHARWQTGPEAVLVRRQEDEAAGRVLGAATIHLDLPDCIYRRLPDGTFLVNGEDDLWKSAHPQEAGVARAIRRQVLDHLDAAEAGSLVLPLALGSHIDHNLVRAAFEDPLPEWVQLWFYADYPYAVRHPAALASSIRPGWQPYCYPVSEDGLAAWQRAVAEHQTQISTFWNGLDEMRASIRAYWREGEGSCLWQVGKGEISNNLCVNHQDSI